MHLARILDGVVVEILDGSPELPPLAERYHPDFLAQCVPVPAELPVVAGWLFSDGAFTAPAD